MKNIKYDNNDQNMKEIGLRKNKKWKIVGQKIEQNLKNFIWKT